MAASQTAPITLRYRAQRRDVWRWYWRSWRGGLWRTWIGGGLAVAAVMLGLRGREHVVGAQDLVFVAVVLTALAICFVAYPQVAFKTQERVLVAGPSGIDSTIGSKSGHRDWSEIGAVEDFGDGIAIKVAKTGNAFLIPNHAFADVALRALFLRSVAQWRAQDDGALPGQSD